jgi:MFS family permease
VPTSADPAGRWPVLGVLSVALLLGMSGWITAAAAAPQLAALWSLDERQTAWLTTVVQLGFVAGTAVAGLLNLADVLPARSYFAASAVLAAGATAAVLLAPGYEAAIALRFLTGFFLAGVYPPAMKMVATWFRSGRGLAIGVLVGALAVGKALPLLWKGAAGHVEQRSCFACHNQATSVLAFTTARGRERTSPSR